MTRCFTLKHGIPAGLTLCFSGRFVGRQPEKRAVHAAVIVIAFLGAAAKLHQRLAGGVSDRLGAELTSQTGSP